MKGLTYIVSFLKKPYFLHFSHSMLQSPPWDNNKLNFASNMFLFLKCFSLQMLPIKKKSFFSHDTW
jgi:hypothetical protein